MAKPTGKPNGRPKAYTEELAQKVLNQLALGKSVRRIAKMDGMPAASTIFLWQLNVPGFSEQYDLYKRWGIEALVDEAMDIADDGTNDFMEDEYMKGKTPGYQLNGENIQRSKLRVDTRLKVAAKLHPKKYGDKLDMTTNGKDLPQPIYGGLSVKDQDV